MESSSQHSLKRKSSEEPQVPQKVARSLTPLIMDEIIEEIVAREESLTPPLPAVIDSEELVDLIDLPTPPEKTGPKTPEGEDVNDLVERIFGPKTPERGADDKVEKTGPKTPEGEADDKEIDDEPTISEKKKEFVTDIPMAFVIGQARNSGGGATQEQQAKATPKSPRDAIIEEWSFDQEDHEAGLLVPRPDLEEADVEPVVKRQSWREENNVVTIESGTDDDDDDSDDSSSDDD